MLKSDCNPDTVSQKLCQFSTDFFHRQTLWKICGKLIKDPTTAKMCRYTTLQFKPEPGIRYTATVVRELS